GRRQRRPTGAPPPLPHPVTITTTAWLVLAALVLAGAFVASQHTPWLRIEDRASTWVLRQLAGLRTPWLTDVANGINVAGSGWGAAALGLSVVVLIIVFRRWRHLLVFMGSLLFLEFAGTWIYFQLSRPRPYGVPIITSWAGYSGVSPPLAVLTIFLMGIVYCLALAGPAPCSPQGRPAPLSPPCPPSPACIWVSITPAMCSSARRSRRRSRSPRSATSPRTRCSPSPTGAAAPRMWM